MDTPSEAGSGERDDHTVTLPRSSADGSTAELVVPRRIGSTHLIREIGHGGMGTVYLGHDEMLGRDVAVKFLLNAVSGTDDPGFKRFLEGARAAAAVRHSGLTTIYQADLIKNVPYLVMEFIDGPTLRQVLTRNGPLSIAATLVVIEAVSSAIGALHDRDIVHRDIKPSNVLMDDEGIAYVTDFGLSCRRGSSPSGAGGLAGTAPYMAPEMFDGTISLRSDVYALGITTFELLTGELPFSGSKSELPRKHGNEPLPTEPLRKAGAHEVVVEVLQRATHKNAMFRYKSASYFVRALRDSVAGEGRLGKSVTADEMLVAGAAELKDIVFALHKTRPEQKPIDKSEEPSTSTYFDRLADLAREKRGKRETPPAADATAREAVASPAAPPERPAKQRTLQADVPCVGCDYNLRGLAADGRCPECGQAVSSSVSPDRLLFANPTWLSTIALGQALILAAVIAIPVLFLVVMFVVFSVLQLPIAEFAEVMRLLGWAIVGGGIATGVFMSTRREPALAAPKRTSLTARIARVCALVGLPGFGAGMTMSSFPGGVGGSGTAFIPLGEFVQFTGFAANMIGALSFLLYLRKLAERVPDAKLLRSSRQLATLLCALVPLGLGCLALNARLVPAGALPDTLLMSWLKTAIVGVAAVLTAATVLFYGSLMVAYRRAMKRVIAASVSYGTLFGHVPPDVSPPSAPTDAASDGKPGGRSMPTSEGTLHIDLLCVKCGYNLKGLPGRACCPECGVAASASLDSCRLLFADPKWLSRIHTGTRLLFTVVVGSLAVQFLYPIFLVFRSRWDSSIVTFLTPAIGLMFILVFLAGVRLLTTPEPGTSPPLRTTVNRWTAIVAMDITIVAFVVEWVCLPERVDPKTLQEAAAINADPYADVGELPIWVATICVLLAVRTLAQRVPDRKLLRRSHLLLVLMVLVMLGSGFAISWGFLGSGDTSAGSAITPIVGILVFVVQIGGLLFTIHLCRTVRRVRAGRVSLPDLLKDLEATPPAQSSDEPHVR